MQKGNGAKAIISQETFQALSEIVKLRSNGLTIQEIKELKSQKPSRNILDEVEEPQPNKKDDDALSLGIGNGSDVGKVNGSQSAEDLIVEVEVETVEPVGLTNGDLSPDSKSVSETDIDSDSDSGSELAKDNLDEQSQEQGQRRRRGFNYRYVERQIANDSKRVYSLRQRLRSPNLSVRDRLFFEEALERRILFLNGWKHILRWITK